jgi:hypothetical protein
MAGRPPKPTALQVASGRDEQNPGRYRDRKKNEPTGLSDVGDPPDYIKDTPECMARTAWKTFSIEIPWLTQSDRANLELACKIRGAIIADQEVGVPRMTLLRGLLQSMGATPADKAKIVGGGSASDEETKERKTELFKKPW